VPSFWDLEVRLATRGRTSLLFVPKDLWFGWYRHRDPDKPAEYVTLVPMFPVRVERRSNNRAERH
jgi:hypothetical protein